MGPVVRTAPGNADLVLRALRRRPDETAFTGDGGSLTYAGAAALIGRMQAVMAAAGLRGGRRVAVLAGNDAMSWCAGVAAQASGLSITPLHPLGSLDDHHYQLDDAGCDALVVDGARFGPRGGELAEAAAGLQVTWTLGAAGYGVDLVRAAEEVGSYPAYDQASPDDVAIINYTSGTSGRPKGALRRHRTLSASNLAILADFDLPSDPQYLAVAPISHVAGTKIVPVLVRGGTVHLQAGFDPERVLATVAARGVNMTLLVPTMVYALLDHPALDGADLSSLELVLYGASAMSPARLVEALERIGPVFSQLYGQTESYPLTVLGRQDHDAARPERFASCGFPVASAQVRLLDDDGQAVAPGSAGEICARSPYVMDEFWKLPDLTAETLAHGWLHTGDVGVVDDEGYLYVVDRKKDMIVTGGFNVFSREVEDAISAHPAVAAVAVIGVPDPRWGEAVHALVTRRPGAGVEADELIALVRERKGPVFAPKAVEFVDALPVTGTGKVDKKVLRAPYWQGRDRSVG